jgi:hypothetical protein
MFMRVHGRWGSRDGSVSWEFRMHAAVGLIDGMPWADNVREVSLAPGLTLAAKSTLLRSDTGNRASALSKRRCRARPLYCNLTLSKKQLSRRLSTAVSHVTLVLVRQCLFDGVAPCHNSGATQHEQHGVH